MFSPLVSTDQESAVPAETTWFVPTHEVPVKLTVTVPAVTATVKDLA